MNKVAIYARLSEDDYNGRKVSTSVENQIKNLTEYANKNNMIIYNVYADDCYSGKDFNRPAFQRMLSDLKQKKFDTLLVKDISRIGRNLIYVGKFIEETCPLYGIRLLALLDNYDSKNNDSSDIILKSFFNDYYLRECRKKKNLQIKKDYDANIALLKFSIYGYDYHNNKLYVNKKQAKIVKWIFEAFASGMRPKDMVIYLKEHKVISPAYIFNEKYHCVRGKPTPYSWNRNGLCNIARDTVYIGEYINGKCSSNFERKVVKGFAPAIVSKELFVKAQEQIDKRSRKIVNPYHGLLVDKNTGLKFMKCKTPHYIEGVDKYLATTKHNIWISIDVYDLINKEIDAILDELKAYREFILEKIDPIYIENKRNKEQFLKECKTCEIEIKKSLEMYLLGKINKIEYKNKISFLKNRILWLKEKIKYLDDVLIKIDEVQHEKNINELLDIQVDEYPILAKIIFKNISVTKLDNKVELEFVYNRFY